MGAPWGPENEPAGVAAKLAGHLAEANDDGERAGLNDGRPWLQKWGEALGPEHLGVDFTKFCGAWTPGALFALRAIRAKLHGKHLGELRQHAPLIELVSGRAAFVEELMDLVGALVAELDHIKDALQPSSSASVAQAKAVKERLDRIDAGVKSVAAGMRADLTLTLRS